MLRILLDWQYEIFEVDDGSTAIKEVNNQHFDLILMDIRMPGISGMEALAWIRSLIPDVPVVMMTAFFSDEIVVQTRNKSAFDCLGKPFDLKVLRQTVECAIVS